MLRPRSIAVIGGGVAEAVVAQCIGLGFAGEIWPVHPTRATIGGRPCHRAVEDLPAAPDAAFVAVNRHLTIDVVERLARLGAGGAVAYASGFGETGADGSRLQQALVDAAGAMRLIGPNCYGLINYLDGVPLWPDSHGGKKVERGVAILTQSSNIALNITMNRRGLPLAYLCTLGNQAATDMAALADFMLDDDRVTAIGLHIEGIDDLDALAALARKARARQVPIIALKAGRSAIGARLALGHTASIAGAEAVMTALFKRLGIGQVKSLPALLECLKLLHAGGPLDGSRIISLSCSGGEAALMSDAAMSLGLTFPALSDIERARIRDTVSDLVRIDNPFDYHTFDWGDGRRLEATFAAAAACDVDLAALVLDMPRADRCSGAAWQTTLDAFRRAAATTGRRAAVIASLPECLPEATAEMLLREGIAPLAGIDDALGAIDAAAFVGQAPAQAAPWPRPNAAEGGPIETIDEWAVKCRLSDYGIHVPDGTLCRSSGQALEAAARLGGSVVLKAVSKDLHHKTERGAVRLGLRAPSAIEQAARQLLTLGDGVAVERQIEDGVAELIVGVGRDPAAGLYLLIGFGGILAELYADRAVLLFPVERGDVETALRSLKAAAVLFGHRRQPAGDVEAVIDAVLAIQRFAADHLDDLVELEINPLIVRPAGHGAVAVDGLLRLHGKEVS